MRAVKCFFHQSSTYVAIRTQRTLHPQNPLVSWDRASLVPRTMNSLQVCAPPPADPPGNSTFCGRARVPHSCAVFRLLGVLCRHHLVRHLTKMTSCGTTFFKYLHQNVSFYMNTNVGPLCQDLGYSGSRASPHVWGGRCQQEQGLTQAFLITSVPTSQSQSLRLDF